MIPVSRGKKYVQAAYDTVLEHNNRFASYEMPSGLLEVEAFAFAPKIISCGFRGSAVRVSVIEQRSERLRSHQEYKNDQNEKNN
jgi:hypothetical protein